MATFDSAVRSQAQSRPIILYTITTTGTVYRFTTSAADVTYAGHLFPALTVNHEDEQVTQDESGDELIIHLPITQPLVQRYAATGIPEESVQVLVQELQSTASTAAMSWSGSVQSLSISGHLAALRVPTATNDALKIQLPVIAADRTCNHVLFDIGCAPNPGGDWPVLSGNGHGGPVGFLSQAILNVASVSANGLEITLVSDGGQPDQFYQFGKALLSTVYAPTTYTLEDQTRSIVSHVGNVITLNVPFVAPAEQIAGAKIRLEAGCDHSIATCISKFGNRTNFGGHPKLDSTINPWAPSGLGVTQQV